MKSTRLILIGLAVIMLGCDNEELARLRTENGELQETVTRLEKEMRSLRQIDARMNFMASRMQGLKARIVTDYGNMEFKLFPELAPIHCFVFAARAEAGYYDNVIFHRVMEGFMIQTGDPNSKDNNPYDDGLGGSILKTPHEFNAKHHAPGILSTARVPDKSQGAGSQFFIVHGESPHLDNEYTAFGEMTSGMAVLNKIATVETNKSDPRLVNRPLEDIKIKTIEVYF